MSHIETMFFFFFILNDVMFFELVVINCHKIHVKIVQSQKKM